MGFLSSLQQLHQTLQRTGKNISISADEWGLGPPWKVKTFGVPHAIYAASFLSAVTQSASSANLRHTNYFEPINEGAISVKPFRTSLTPVGQVMELYAQHQKGTRIVTSIVNEDGNLNVLATLHGDRKVIMTVANL